MAQTPEQIKNYINARLSLRSPQADSLNRLHHILDGFGDLENIPSDQLLQKIQSISSEFKGFDFDFPSMCYALATGVGKTRLMGAIIYYLYKAKNIRNFFVIAPNKTIYNKLKEDFSYGSKKYVFKGLGDVDGQNPLIVHGDNFSQVNQALNYGLDILTNKFTINIFNIDKFNSKKENEKIKKFSEYIGESYYQYLQNLKDLVVLMDESHRYRADSSRQAINGLKPILGFEFTATPYTVKGSKKSDFSNVLYRYNLANAIKDGFVKTPWVATRENINTANYTKEGLDYLKITDGIAIHEKTKVDLKVFSDNSGKPYVKPFMMISAIDQNHADQIESMLKTYKDGKYKDKIVKIYSGLGADEEENVEKLLEIEKSDNPIEIVIQVMMLKEGWDVNNLYTIVPLRASTSQILTEQTIGRGLRLPYGNRVGEAAIDRLTIVAHDKYEDVINEANRPDSLVRNVINLDDENNFNNSLEIKVSKPTYLNSENNLKNSDTTKNFINNNIITEEESIVINNFLNENAINVIQNEQNIGDEKTRENISRKLINIVNSADDKTKLVFGKLSEDQKQKFIAGRTIEIIRDLSKYEIQIPRVTFYRPDPDPKFNKEFKIDTSFIDRFNTPESSIKIKSLTTEEVEKYKVNQQINIKGNTRDYFVNLMMNIPELDYDEYSDWMYSMADDLVNKMRNVLGEKTDEEYKLYLFYYKDYTIERLKEQLLSKNCYSINILPGEVRVNNGFRSIKGHTYSFIPGCSFDYRETNFDKLKIKSYIFSGFKKTSEEFMKFDSDTERKLSVILEEDEKVIKRIRPMGFSIDYYFENTRSAYEPDFIVETNDSYYIIETKDASKVGTPIVQAKKQFTLEWIEAVNNNTEGKKWKYAMIADNHVKDNYTFDFITSLQA